MKWSWFGLLTCAALGCWAMAFISASRIDGAPTLKAAPEVRMRAVPSVTPRSAEQRAQAEAPKPALPNRKATSANLEAAEVGEPQPSSKPKTPLVAEPEAPVKVPAEKVTAEAAARATVPMGGDGILNLIASDSAEVLLDGTRIGPSPKRGIRLTAGNYKVRFDCYDGDGELKAGAEQAVVVVAGKETLVDYECPTTH